jgi:hypothetical protein
MSDRKGLRAELEDIAGAGSWVSGLYGVYWMTQRTSRRLLAKLD